MSAARSRYDRAEEAVLVGDEGRLWVGENGGLIGSRDAVGRAGLASLRAAVRRADYYLGLGSEVSVTLYDAAEDQLLIDDEAFVSPPIEITLLPDRCLVTCTMVGELGMRFSRSELTAQMAAVLARRRLLVLELAVYDELAITVAHLTCEVLGRGRTLEDVAEAADDLIALWYATLGGDLTPGTALDLLRAQRAELLIGQAESSWLEAKRQPYRLDEPEQQLELAKDVAALGNTQDGGILVIGLATAKSDGIDTISKVRPIPFAMIDPRRYRRVIDRFVYPPADGLLVERVETEPGKGLLVVAVPGQAAELQPLLVLGAVVGKKVVGSHVSIVRRREDMTTATHPAALHSLIAAGRAALAGRIPQGSELPD